MLTVKLSICRYLCDKISNQTTFFQYYFSTLLYEVCKTANYWYHQELKTTLLTLITYLQRSSPTSFKSLAVSYLKWESGCCSFFVQFFRVFIPLVCVSHFFHALPCFSRLLMSPFCVGRILVITSTLPTLITAFPSIQIHRHTVVCWFYCKSQNFVWQKPIKHMANGLWKHRQFACTNKPM